MRLHCSFCGRDQHQVRSLFRGLPIEKGAASVYICDECIEQCSERLRQDRLAEAEEKPLETNAEARPEPARVFAGPITAFIQVTITSASREEADKIDRTT